MQLPDLLVDCKQESGVGWEEAGTETGVGGPWQVGGGTKEEKEKGFPHPLTFHGPGALLWVCLQSCMHVGILQEFHPES